MRKIVLLTLAFLAFFHAQSQTNTNYDIGVHSNLGTISCGTIRNIPAGNLKTSIDKSSGNLTVEFLHSSTGYFFYNGNLKLDNSIIFTYKDHPGTDVSGSVDRPDNIAFKSTNAEPDFPVGSSAKKSASQTHNGVTYEYNYWEQNFGTVEKLFVEFTNINSNKFNGSRRTIEWAAHYRNTVNGGSFNCFNSQAINEDGSLRSGTLRNRTTRDIRGSNLKTSVSISNLRATANACDGALITWDQNDASIGDANLQWEVIVGGVSEGFISGNRRSYQKNNLDAGPFTFEVKAYFGYTLPNSTAIRGSRYEAGSATGSIAPEGFSGSFSNFNNTGNCDGSINLTWDFDNADATGYEIYRSTNNTFSSTPLTTITPKSYVDRTATSGNTYNYRIKAVRQCSYTNNTGSRDDKSGFSSTIAAEGGGNPTAPTAVIVDDALTNNAAREITLTWQDNTGTEDGYRIVRSSTSGTVQIDVNKNQTSYVDNGLQTCELYTYRVKAFNSCATNGVQSISSDTVSLAPDVSNTFSSASNSTQKIEVTDGDFGDRIELKWNTSNRQNETWDITRTNVLDTTDQVTVASLPSGTKFYSDNTALANTLYCYEIQGVSDCAGQTVLSNTSEDLGFRLAFGTVNGQITYGGGTAVEGVKVEAQSVNGAVGKSGLFDGSADYMTVKNDADFNTTAFTIAAFIKPDYAATGRQIIAAKYTTNNGWIAYLENNNLKFRSNATERTLTTPTKSNGNWSNVAITVSGDTVRAYWNGVLTDTKIFPSAVNLTTTDLLLGKDLNGNFYKGNLDEVRYYKRALTTQEIARSFDVFVNPSAIGLVGYWRFDEGVGNTAYDYSKVQLTPNRNHAVAAGSVTFSGSIPGQNQLSAGAYTNASGSYFIPFIPYQGTGDNFTITPTFGVHTFTPANTTIFLGGSNPNFSGIDFIDNSSFTVKGSVVFEGTTCPSEDVFIAVDGVVATVANEPVKTNAVGDFVVEVPIGEHFIALQKSGHYFSNGRFPPTGVFDFQDSLVIPTAFDDSTLRIVVGRVAGGAEQQGLKPGLGRGKNNIGSATINFNVTNAPGCIASARTTVTTSPQTGEYVIALPPLNYEVPNFSTKSGAITFGSSTKPNANLNLTRSLPLRVVRDTIVDTTVNVQIIDTIAYHLQRDFIKYNAPTVDVLTLNQDKNYGEDTIVLAFIGQTIKVASDQLQADLTKPIPTFIDGKTESLLVSAFEIYINDDSTNVKLDSLPVSNGTINIVNDFATTVNNSFSISPTDTLKFDGLYEYDFTVGAADVIVDPTDENISFTENLQVKLTTTDGPGNNASRVVTNWEPYGNGVPFRARVFGAVPVGGAYVTLGPQVVTMILRDPPGSESYAEWVTGTSQTTTSTFNVTGGGSVSTEASIKAGTAFSASAGPISVDAEATATGIAGMTVEAKGGTGDEYIETVTLTSAVRTSSTIDFVGSDADLFIGRSMNMDFGLSNLVTLAPLSDCANPNITCAGDTFNTTAGSFQFATKKTLLTVPGGYGTEFIFTQRAIIETIIPRLEVVRNQYLSNATRTRNGVATNLYQNFITDTDYFGRSNDDSTLLNVASSSPVQDITPNSMLNNSEDAYGRSYLFTGYDTLVVRDTLIVTEILRPLSQHLNNPVRITRVPYVDTIVQGVDSVWWYNQQIRLWEEAIARNEREKVTSQQDSAIEKNISISAGASITNTRTTEKIQSTTTEWSTNVSGELGLQLKAELAGNGVSSSSSITVGVTTQGTDATTNAVSNTVSYTIVDNDDDDDISVDVFAGNDGFSPSFRVRGGQTSCPYQGEEVTQYYQPGTVLNVATIPIENPQMSVFPASLSNIPANSPGVFNLTLANPTDFDNVYSMRIVESSNPFGAILRVDGLSPNRDFAVPANSSIQKQITIERGADSIRYDSIKILLTSTCQFAFGTAGFEDIFDEVVISADFLPSCTDLEVSSPGNQFVFNNDFNNQLPVTISNYDINYSGLRKIDLQYKPSSQSAWRTLDFSWYKNAADIPAKDTLSTTIPVGQAFINYNFDFKPFIDQNYQFRAVSECLNKSEFSEVIGGIVDRVNPSPFGIPSPADGVLDPNDEIRIRFNEPIEAGSLTRFNFQVNGVINGQPLRNDKAVAFDGVNDYMEIANGLSFLEEDFTIEFWLKRASNGSEQTIISQGASASNTFSIGFTASDQLKLQVGNQVFVGDTVESELNKWKHYTVSYERDSLTLTTSIRSGTTIKTEIESNYLTNYSSSGKTFIGKSAVTNANYFDGSIHELRLWSRYLTTAQVSSRLGISLSGREAGLLAYYPMNEGRGVLAQDKARLRNAQIFATWEINPKSSSATFDGISHYASLDSAGTLTISDEGDMTIEFWFKTSGTVGTTTSLLSNGSGREIATDLNTNGWNIEMNANNQIVVKNDTQTFVAVSTDFADDDWHHFALVLNRLTSLTAYIDGNQQNSTPSAPFSGFGATKLVVGARFSLNGTAETVDNYFNGNMDEVRIWNAARLSESMELDRFNRLSGDEFGLLAYYPFESDSLTLGVPVLFASLTDESTNGLDLTAYNGMGTSTETPAIALQRQVSAIGYTWNVNNDEIVITPTDAPARIENVTINVAVKDVLDLQGNAMSSTKSWIAFVNKNQVLWQDFEKNLTKEFNDTMTFTSAIANSGGELQSFNITNLPFWLSASPSSGTINPLTTETITFTVNQSVNIGDYSEDVLLSTDFGFDEKLLVNLKVRKTAPDFTFNPNLYQNSMSIIGQIRINGIVSANEDDKLIAYINNEIRGVANLEYQPTYDKYIVFLDVYSNTSDSIEFRVWNSAKGELHTDIQPNIYFVTNGLVGTPIAPQFFDAEDNISKPIVLNRGWNWVSFPMSSSVMKDFDLFFEGLDFEEGDVVKTIGNNANAIYGDSTGWFGNLTATGISPDVSYLIHISNLDTMDFRGFAIDPDTLTISVDSGWNRVGFVSLKNLSINTALGAYNAQNGDLVKSQQQFAFYDQNLGWVGSLKTLESTKGYLLSTTAASTFVYPRTGLLRMKAPENALENERNTLISYNLNPSDYEASTSAIVQVETCEELLASGEYALAAYHKGQLRGYAEKANQVNEELGYQYFITVFGNHQEEYTFELIGNADRVKYELAGTLNYRKNELTGTPTSPLTITPIQKIECKKEDLLMAETLTGNVVYPNPFTNELTIEIPQNMSEQTLVSLIDEHGRVLHQENTNGKLELIWSTKTGMKQLSSGVYHIRFADETQVEVKKVIKL